MDWQERIDKYVRKTGFPKSLFIGDDGRAIRVWMLGNNYKIRSGYHGGFPPTFLARIKALFPDKFRVLHLFSGKVDLSLWEGRSVDPARRHGDVRADLDPTYVDDCQTLEKVPLENYDLVLCDPPYTGEDAERYGATMVRRKKSPEGVGTVSGQRPRRLAGSGFADVAPGLFRAGGGHWNWKSTNHRFRELSIFRRP